MQVIFLFIPVKTSLKELERYALSGVGFRLPFMRDTKILSCEILDISDKSNQTNESHGVVSYANPKDAHKAIEKLNGKAFKGKIIEVREFMNRSPSDKRVHQIRGGKQIFKDSRREGLVINKRSEGNRPKPNKNPPPNVLYSPQSDITYETTETRMRKK